MNHTFESCIDLCRNGAPFQPYAPTAGIRLAELLESCRSEIAALPVDFSVSHTTIHIGRAHADLWHQWISLSYQHDAFQVQLMEKDATAINELVENICADVDSTKTVLLQMLQSICDIPI